MSRLPIPHIINTIKTKLGFDRTMTAPGDDVVDAVNKQSQQIDKLGDTAAALESGIAIIVNGDTATQAVPAGYYAYIKNNTHGLTEGLYKNKSSSAFPATGGTADSTVFESVSNGGINELKNYSDNTGLILSAIVNATWSVGSVYTYDFETLGYSVANDKKLVGCMATPFGANVRTSGKYRIISRTGFEFEPDQNLVAQNVMICFFVNK